MGGSKSLWARLWQCLDAGCESPASPSQPTGTGRPRSQHLSTGQASAAASPLHNDRPRSEHAAAGHPLDYMQGPAPDADVDHRVVAGGDRLAALGTIKQHRLLDARSQQQLEATRSSEAMPGMPGIPGWDVQPVPQPLLGECTLQDRDPWSDYAVGFESLLQAARVFSSWSFVLLEQHRALVTLQNGNCRFEFGLTLPHQDITSELHQGPSPEMQQLSGHVPAARCLAVRASDYWRRARLEAQRQELCGSAEADTEVQETRCILNQQQEMSGGWVGRRSRGSGSLQQLRQSNYRRSSTESLNLVQLRQRAEKQAELARLQAELAAEDWVPARHAYCVSPQRSSTRSAGTSPDASRMTTRGGLGMVAEVKTVEEQLEQQRHSLPQEIFSPQKGMALVARQQHMLWLSER